MLPVSNNTAHEPPSNLATTMLLTLTNRWLALCNEAGLDGSAQWSKLVDAYSDPARAYHNLTHVDDCLIRFDEYVHLTVDPVAVEFAIWFHDIVYDTHAHDNEERSAAVAAEFLSGTGLEPVVAGLIQATRHVSPPASPDAALLCDIDLSILGSDPGVYDSYASAIRQEYAWVPLEEYASTRIRLLESFLGRPAVFATPQLETCFGDQARSNLRREIASLAGMVND